MSLSQKIDQDLLRAMKSKNTAKISTLRLVKAAITNAAIEKKKKELDEDELLTIFQKQIKQRLESLESFKAAGRQELVENEEKELAILKSYLPEQLTDDQLRELVLASIQSTGAKTKADIGLVMKDLMPRVKGKADGKRVNSFVTQLLQTKN